LLREDGGGRGATLFSIRNEFSHTKGASSLPIASTREGRAMARWLFKQEPTCYAFADLERDGTTSWDGVKNALAVKYLRQVKRGDRILFYHNRQRKSGCR